MAGGGGGGGGQEPGKDNSFFILWLLFLIGLVCAAIWWTLSEQLKTLFVYIRLAEIEAAAFIVEYFPTNLIPREWWDIASLQSQMQYDKQFVENLTPQTLSLEEAHYISERAGKYWLYPLSLLIGAIGLYYFFSNIQMRLKHKFNMRTLLTQEKSVWPQVKIVDTLDILKEDLDKGPWAMAQTPMQYAKANHLIAVTLAERKDSGFSKTKYAEFQVSLSRMHAERAFSAQLGRIWRGALAMPPYRRAIFAVFVGRGARDTKAAQKLVRQLANSAAKGHLDCQGADELWQKHIQQPGIQRILNEHAYEFTVFISLLMYAREDGVLPSSDFLWVKPLDRRLWYVINNVGRQTPGVEVGGIFAHWNTETALKRALSVPIVVDAVNALEVALSEIIYIPSEEEREEIFNREKTSSTKTTAASSVEAED